MNNIERDRIYNFINAELPDSGYLLFKATTDTPNEKLRMITSVIDIVSLYDENDWPKDEQWDDFLPAWFLNKIKNYTLEEINSNSLLWDYGSWLDAMKYRGWKWYSSKIETHNFIIILEPNSFPFSVNPLEYLIYETEIATNSITFEDHS